MCCKYKKVGKSNMAVLEFNSLTGYSIDDEKLDSLTGIRHLQRVESEKGNTKANVYFNEVHLLNCC